MSEVATIAFQFPMPANRANARGHWRRHHTEMKRYYDTLDRLVLVKRIPAPPEEPFYKVRATVTLHLYNRMDQGNAINRMKWIEDWLVKRKYVVDDSEMHWEYTGLPKQVINRAAQFVELTLEPKPAPQTTLF